MKFKRRDEARMDPIKLNSKIPQLLTGLFYLLMLVAVLQLMSYVQSLLDEDAKINLTEVVTQNKDVITSRINLEVTQLDSYVDQLSDRFKRSSDRSTEALEKIFLEYTNDNQNDRLFIAPTNGIALFADGSKYDIAGRRYFKLALQGVHNISDRIVSRKNGEEIFVISVPIYLDGQLIATLQRLYSPEEMYDLCSISLFSSAGYMYIINREGYILISSKQSGYSREAENYYWLLFEEGNRDASVRLENDIQNDRSGFLETTIDGKKVFSAYTPIEDVHDWYLISSVTNDAVTPNGNMVIRIFYFILSCVILIFALSVLAFLAYKNRQQARLERIAFIDNVTQGNTLNKFMVNLQELLRKFPNKQYSLLKFDIDNFKYVNNFYGFDFGDKVLNAINQGVTKQLQPGETSARVSSDNFVALLEDASEERVVALLSAAQEDVELSLYLSAGIYAITNASESVELMIDKASTAAETVKGSFGKHIAYYSEQFDQMMIHNEQLKRSVQQALTGDEMLAFYQPKVDIDTGKLVGAEALVRWRTKEGKLIPPFEFIPLCERTGLIVELDMIVFEKVLHFLQGHYEQGTPCVPISVNFSRLHLQDPLFWEKMIDLMERYRVPPSLIEIELTESAMFGNLETILSFINRLHEVGLSISMDDFGSGYSSLNMLQDIPIDVLKIDKAFLQKTANAQRQRIIFSAIAQMAEQLHIAVVVEGVETAEHVELMREVGFRVAQGYYYAKPMEEGAFEKIFREGIIS